MPGRGAGTGAKRLKRSRTVLLTISEAKLAYGFVVLEKSFSKAAKTPAKSCLLSAESPRRKDRLMSLGDPSSANILPRCSTMLISSGAVTTAATHVCKLSMDSAATLLVEDDELKLDSHCMSTRLREET
jgi:hypothetical protein